MIKNVKMKHKHYQIVAESYARAEGLYNAQLAFLMLQIQNKLILARAV